MKLLKTIKDSDIFPGAEDTDYSGYRKRPAARAVLFDENNDIAFLHVTKNNYHKLPGGGVEDGETPEQGLMRELLEETGCHAEILKEIGEIIEYRDKHKLINDSFFWTAKVVGNKGELDFTEDEIEGGFELNWVNLDDAISALEKDEPTDYQGHFIKQRDLIFLKEAKKLI
jgi:8-oxo-dGTP pyrophosphatase MutT (NUDIX family)